MHEHLHVHGALRDSDAHPVDEEHHPATAPPAIGEAADEVAAG